MLGGEVLRSASRSLDSETDLLHLANADLNQVVPASVGK